jgi:hypothetical protein
MVSQCVQARTTKLQSRPAEGPNERRSWSAQTVVFGVLSDANSELLTDATSIKRHAGLLLLIFNLDPRNPCLRGRRTASTVGLSIDLKVHSQAWATLPAVLLSICRKTRMRTSYLHPPSSRTDRGISISEPFLSNGQLNFKAHDVGWIIAGFFGGA